MLSQSSQELPPSEQSYLSLSLATGSNRFWQIALLVFSLVCFLEISQVLSLVHIHLIVALLGLLALTLLASRRAFVFCKTGAGRVLPFFVGWVGLSYLLSPHTEGSSFFMVNVLEGTLLFLAAAGLLNTVSDYRRFFRILAAAGLLLSVMGIVWGGVINGRHALRAGSYSDPNYYAMALLSVAPILWIAFEWKSWWMKIGGFLVTALPLLLAVRTISRGGFVAMLAMLVVLFFLSSLKMKVIMASIAVLAVVILVAFLPDSVRARVAAAARISIPSGDPSTQTNDQVSVSSRETMLATSINVTLAYPLLGVGPGNFGPTIVEFGKLQNMHWINLSTHNSYTQLSSETGIAGILLFLLMFGFAVKAVMRTLRRTSSGGAHPNVEIHRWSAGMLILLAANATCMFFLSEGYGMRNFLWFGLASGLQLLLPDEPKEEEEWVEVVPEPTVR